MIPSTTVHCVMPPSAEMTGRLTAASRQRVRKWWGLVPQTAGPKKFRRPSACRRRARGAPVLLRYKRLSQSPPRHAKAAPEARNKILGVAVDAGSDVGEQRPVHAAEIHNRAGPHERRGRQLCKLRLRLPGQIDRSGRFTIAECQMRAEFPGERTHRVVLRTRCYAKGLVPLLGPR